MHIKSIHIYPIKSTHVVDVTEIDVGARGLADDRRWMIIDAAGKFMTQREYPKLALIQSQITPEGLQVSAPHCRPFVILSPERGPTTAIKIWSHEGEAYEGPANANQWFSEFLGVACSIVWQGDILRSTSIEWSRPGDQVSFADGYPILVTTTGSLADLNRRMEAPLPMNRFRPNIVIECDTPWAEDEWRMTKIGAVELELVKPCARCVITTTDQETGERTSKDPLATLTQFRLVQQENLKGAIFGQNAVPRKMGTIRIGDAVEVVSTQAAPEFKVFRKKS